MQPAQHGCLFCIIVEEAEVAKGTITKMLPDVGGTFSCKRPCPGEECGLPLAKVGRLTSERADEQR